MDKGNFNIISQIIEMEAFIRIETRRKRGPNIRTLYRAFIIYL